MELKNYIGGGLLMIYMNSIYVIIYHAGIEKLPTMAILLCFAEHENHKQSVTQTKTKKTNKQTHWTHHIGTCVFKEWSPELSVYLVQL